MNAKEAIEEYQCPGCVCGMNVKCGRFEKHEHGVSCGRHVPGTRMSFVGLLFLGLPKGFHRLGSDEKMKPVILESWDQLVNMWGSYNPFNVPVWKHLDKHGNTLVRGLHPRINFPFLHIILEDCLDKINCLEVTQKDIEEMD